MKHIYLQLAAGLAATFTIGSSTACAQQQDSVPEAPQAELPIPSNATPKYDNWLDAPQTHGNWRYQVDPTRTLAYFRGRENSPSFQIICERQSGVTLKRFSNSSEQLAMRIRTETVDRMFSAEPIMQSGRGVGVTLSADDPLLDAMAITQGRFAVEVEGLPTLYLPAWAEVTRVIEDCR